MLFRLDYCGIAILIVGSIVPLLYYQFYCEFGTKVAYLTLISVLGAACIIISMWDKFSASEYRVYRACKSLLTKEVTHPYTTTSLSLCLVLFITFGLFGFIPTCHYILRFGVEHAFTGTSLRTATRNRIRFFQPVPLIICSSSLHCTSLAPVSMLVIASERNRAFPNAMSFFLSARIPERLAPGVFDIWVGD